MQTNTALWKSELQRDIELLQTLIQRKAKYTAYQSIFVGRNSFSKTDTDATFMHMKEDHMRNSQLKPGYNIQFAVEGEYITGVDVSSERSDQLALIPLMEKMEANDVEYADVTLDAGYESEENYIYYECEDCSDCPHKKSCTRAKGNRKMQVSKNFIRQRQESLQRITSTQGNLLRTNRSIQSEGAFGVVNQDYGFVRFLHRGSPKVFMEILLVAWATT